MIDSINKEGLVINNNTHLVGFSLGAHVSGFVGKELKNLSRITGKKNLTPLSERESMCGATKSLGSKQKKKILEIDI